MSITKLSNNYLENLMKGACFLGCGGGGSLDMANEVLETLKKLNKDKNLSMVDLEDIEEDDYLCFIAGVGAPSAEVNSPFSKSPLYSYENLVELFETDRSQISKFKYVIPGETGAMNSLLPLLVCAQSDKDIKIVNADGAGRALPQLKMCTYALSNIKCEPAVIANENGEKIVLESQNPEDLDREIRDKMASNPGFKGAAILASFPMKGSDIKKDNCCVKSSIETTKNIGIALSEKNKKIRHDKLIKIFNEQCRKVLLFSEAYIKNFHSVTKNGFDVGIITLTGKNWSENQSCVIEFVNENLVAKFKWKGITCFSLWAPAMLCFLDDKGEPLSNADIANIWNKSNSIPVSFIGITPDKGLDTDIEKKYFRDLHNDFFEFTFDTASNENDLEKLLKEFHGIEYFIPNN